MRIPLLFCCVVALAAAENDEDQLSVPELTVAEIAECLDGETWARVVLTTSADPDDKERGVAQAGKKAGTIRYKESSRSREVHDHAVADLATLELTAVRHRLISQAERAMKYRQYDLALEMLTALEQEASHPFVTSLKKVAAKGEEAVDEYVRAMAVAEEADAFLAALRAYQVKVDPRNLPEEVEGLIVSAWNRHVARLDEAGREEWQDVARDSKLRLDWDERAPEYLAAGRAAFGEEDYPTAARELERAYAAHAAYEQDDLIALGESMIQTGQLEKAAHYLLQLPFELRKNDEGIRKMLERAGVVSPPFEPVFANLSYVGGKGDQHFSDIAFADDGTISVSAPSGLTVRFSADGEQHLGTEGSLDAACEKGGREFAVRLTRTNPHDGSEWKVGYRQVHSILQQPYLHSPHGWSWWGWNHAQAKEKSLMADTRGVDLWFPTADTFVAWTWSDGGNSTSDRDPRDLEKGNQWTKGYFGGGSKFMLGDAKTGEPIRGWNFAHRPGDACVDDFGNFYVGQLPRIAPDRNFLGSDGEGITIFDPDLVPQGAVRLGTGVRFFDVVVRDDILVGCGRVGADNVGSLTTVDPIQSSPGGGADGFIAIIRLW